MVSGHSNFSRRFISPWMEKRKRHDSWWIMPLSFSQSIKTVNLWSPSSPRQSLGELHLAARPIGGDSTLSDWLEQTRIWISLLPDLQTKREIFWRSKSYISKGGRGAFISMQDSSKERFLSTAVFLFVLILIGILLLYFGFRWNIKKLASLAFWFFTCRSVSRCRERLNVRTVWRYQWCGTS